LALEWWARGPTGLGGPGSVGRRLRDTRARQRPRAYGSGVTGGGTGRRPASIADMVHLVESLVPLAAGARRPID
jgi:hypothetical protein